MSYSCTLQKLVRVLSTRIPEASHICLQERTVEHGLLSVGLKLHLQSVTPGFAELIAELGGMQAVEARNMYRSAHARICIVLPPVGSSRVAIRLLEHIAEFTQTNVFGNPAIQLQVCSPKRLRPIHSAILAIGFYLGSDTIREYSLEDFRTTVTRDAEYRRGTRLVIYDADGAFDRRFAWWSSGIFSPHVMRHLPMISGRTDLLIGCGSKLDIENVNLIATLLAHRESHGLHRGYWKHEGTAFVYDMRRLLKHHMLSGILDAPWVSGGFEHQHNDKAFSLAIKELSDYALSERARLINHLLDQSFAEATKEGILYDMHDILQGYRERIYSRDSIR